MLKICLYILCFFLCLPAPGQDKPDHTIPGLLQLARSSPTDTGRMDYQLQAAYAYVLKPGEDTVDLDSALRLVDEVQKTNTRVNDPRINDQCLPILMQALKIYTAIGHTDLRNLYTLLGSAYAQNGDARNAFGYLLKAVLQEEQLSPEGLGLCTAYNRLAMIYYGFADYPNAEKNFQKALEVAICYKDSSDIRLIGINLVNAKAAQNKPSAALHTLKIIATRYPYTTLHEYITYAAAYISTYSSLGYLDSARIFVDRCIQIQDSLPADDINNAYLYSPIIHYMLAAHRYDLVKRYCQNYRDFCIQKHQWTRLYADYYYLFQADSATRDFEKAVGDFQKYTRLKDSLLSVANSKQIAALELDYETEKKDKDIAVLTREEELSQSALHQAGLIRNTVIGGSVMLLILLGVSYNRYRIKRRGNFLLQLQKRAIDQKNLQLQQLNLSQGRLLNEKEWLLKEIHHRVKNNLQIAMSLLNTQTYYLDNEKAVEAIRQSRNRMFAMSLIHQRLYQSDNLELIHMNRYIPELISYIEDSFARDRNIHFCNRIDPVRLDVAQAVPIGLIINEAVTNSIKYAFPHQDGGTIDILLKYLDGNNILLEIADDGVGVAPGFDIKRTNSMGMQLIDTLNHQLEGTMIIQNRNGLVISIIFLSTSERHPAEAVALLENFA